MNVYSLFLFIHYDFVQKGGGIMERTLLDTLKNRVDTKVGVIAALHTTLKALQNIKPEEKKPSSLDDHKLIIITNFANISCEIINLNDEENKDLSNAQFIIKTALKTTDNYYESFSADTTVINKSKTIVLKNAQVVPFANPQQILNYEVLTIFTDQIVGVTIGSFNQNTN